MQCGEVNNQIRETPAQAARRGPFDIGPLQNTKDFPTGSLRDQTKHQTRSGRAGAALWIAVAMETPRCPATKAKWHWADVPTDDKSGRSERCFREREANRPGDRLRLFWKKRDACH